MVIATFFWARDLAQFVHNTSTQGLGTTTVQDNILKYVSVLLDEKIEGPASEELLYGQAHAVKNLKTA